MSISIPQVSRTAIVLYSIALANLVCALLLVVSRVEHSNDMDTRTSRDTHESPSAQKQSEGTSITTTEWSVLKSPSIAKDPSDISRESKSKARYVTALYFDVSTYTEESDGYPWGKSFASVNFLPGGKLYDPTMAYPWQWTRLSESKRKDENVCAIPRWARWIHEERIEYPSGWWGHKYIVNVNGEWFIPRDRITKSDRLDLLRYISNREARIMGVQKNVRVEIWRIIYE